MKETSKLKGKNVLVNVTIDASVLAIPAVPTKSSIERYVERLLDWKGLQRDSWVDVNTSKFACEKLYSDNVYPDYETIKSMFLKNGIEKYSWKDVTEWTQYLMTQTPHFEDCLEIDEIDADKITTEPDVFKNCPGVKIQNDLKRCVVLLAASQSLSKQKIPYHILALHATQAKSIKVSALVSGFPSYDGKGVSQSKSAKILIENILVAEDIRCIYECVDEAEILLKATSDSELFAAIKIAFYKTNPSNPILSEDIIGNDFLSSIVARISIKPELARPLLRAIVETLQRSNMNETHHLRKGKSGGAPTKKRGSDNAEAWRRNIDLYHHLHYWKGNNNFIELACVSYPHDNYEIPED